VPGVGGVSVLNFGRALGQKETILPGDIMQFTKARFVSRSGRFQNTPQHTAVVAHVDGTKIAVLHQNFDGVRKVHKGDFDLAELREGKVEFFRPVPTP
jgi:hypothetical protein